MTQASEAIRRGAATTSRAVAEQAVAAEQITKAARRCWHGRSAAVTRGDGRAGARRRRRSTAAVDSMRVQAEQAARAAAEQARTMREMTKAATRRARHQADHPRQPRAVGGGRAGRVAQLADIRRITERNAEGVKQTRGGTADLLRQAEALAGIMGERRRDQRRATAAAALDPAPMHDVVPGTRGSDHRPRAVGPELERLAGGGHRPARAAASGPLAARAHRRRPARGSLPRAARRGAGHRHARACWRRPSITT